MAATTHVVAATVNRYILTPLAVILVHRWQMSLGIDPAYVFEAVASEPKSMVDTSGSAASK